MSAGNAGQGSEPGPSWISRRVRPGPGLWFLPVGHRHFSGAWDSLPPVEELGAPWPRGKRRIHVSSYFHCCWPEELLAETLVKLGVNGRDNDC